MNSARFFRRTFRIIVIPMSDWSKLLQWQILFTLTRYQSFTKKVHLVMSNHANCTVVVMQGGNLWWCSAYWDKIYLWTDYLKYRRLGKIAPRFNLVWQMQFSTTVSWKISCSYNIRNWKSVINLTDNSVFLWHVWTPWTERSLLNWVASQLLNNWVTRVPHW